MDISFSNNIIIIVIVAIIIPCLRSVKNKYNTDVKEKVKTGFFYGRAIGSHSKLRVYNLGSQGGSP